MADKLVFHICQKQKWEKAQMTGEYRADSLETEGFIHCSEIHQVAGVANARYSDVPDLILLHIDPNRLTSKMIYEEADGQEFPHVYGAINLDAVVGVSKFEKSERGVFEELV